MSITQPVNLKNYLKVLLCVLGLLCVSHQAISEEPNIRFQQLNLEQGLSQDSVQAIIQDRDGFMWVATQEGLNRYDGYDFKVYSHDETDNSTISSDSILSIAEDRKGQLWIGTENGGLNLFEQQSIEFKHYRNILDDETSLLNDTVRVIYPDSVGRLWIGTDGGLNRYNPTSDNFERYSHHPLNQSSLSNNKVRSIVEDKQGMLWIGTDGGGVNQFNPKTGVFKHFTHSESDPESIVSNRIDSALFDSHGNLWFGSYDGGVSLLAPNETKFKRFANDTNNPMSLGNNYIRDIKEDNDGNVWFATDNGLSRWQPESQRFINFRHDPVNRYSLGNNKVTSLHHDRGNVFWVGTYGGLNKWNSATSAFQHLRNQPNSSTSLSDNNVFSVTQSPNGKVWVGNSKGLNEVDKDKVRYFVADPEKSNSLSDQVIMSLYAESNKSLWIGTRSKGLDHLNPETGNFSNYHHNPENPDSISANGVTMIKPAGNNQLWVATYGGGLNLFDLASNKFKHYRHEPLRKNSLGSDNIMHLLPEADGLLWIATWGSGVNLFDPKKNQAFIYKHQAEDPRSISNDIVFTILEDKNKNLWFGTYGGGLNKLAATDREKGNIKFSHYNRSHGLPSNTIFGIMEDEEGYLWLSSNRGLTKFNPITEEILNYDSSHGLQGNDFNSGAYYQNSNGEMFFGGSNGLTIFNPAKIKLNSHVPPVVLTKYLKMNMPDLENQALRNVELIEIRYEDYFVAFEFAGLDYASPSSNRYRYKLDGFDEEWIDAGTLRRATYTNLPAGRYTFKVKAANNDGVWNEHGVNLAVTVLPPPWKTWWAYLAYFAIVIGLMALIVRAYINKLKKAAFYRIELQQEVQNRTQELQVANEQLLSASVTDQLTGLHNRRFLNDTVEEKVAEVNRSYYPSNGGEDSKERLFFLMFDLDGFKPINDSYGHSAGDNVIMEVGSRLKEACRKSDTLIRWGGDEFLVMGKVTDIGEVSILAERLRRSIQSNAFDIGLKQKLHLSCSIGFSFYPFKPDFPDLLSWEQVQVIADKALYHSKSLGRNTWTGICEGANKPPVSFMHFIADDLNKTVGHDYAKLINFCSKKFTNESGHEIPVDQE